MTAKQAISFESAFKTLGCDIVAFSVSALVEEYRRPKSKFLDFDLTFRFSRPPRQSFLTLFERKSFKPKAFT